MVFGIEELRNSSVGGTCSNYNRKSHAPLDPGKLTFIKSNACTPIEIKEMCSRLLIFTDLFADRVGGDQYRLQNFNRYVNKKCSNSRRSRRPLTPSQNA